ncbi:autotransporter outer membrane beta-barrel domain-containing protein [Oxalobacter aliiformigenes]|uniref:autotransporter outer membrane beta-barrel domain-containing protein n=1 Tax=Oxalobacter aliiformigenes TaxID=2946593 RepID=UPI0022AF621F|nr:autotransporter outer membrane beta-barrel domain-containing protein [Oxalobacter aliiformigenes]MCZ4064547.1 autotransporter outer membrane beta-barrel domain-containing protein [Oxalobacter aliiformigenes]WAV99198.1 autotransporter outer membrane beta-barrel domain-containing protein [Oxalobacter aliiformigenes]
MNRIFKIIYNRFIWSVAKICIHMLDGQETRGKYHNRGYVSRRKIGRKFAQPGNGKTWLIEPQAQLSRYHVRGDNFNMHNGMRIKEFEFRFGLKHSF